MDEEEVETEVVSEPVLVTVDGEEHEVTISGPAAAVDVVVALLEEAAAVLDAEGEEG